MALRYFSNAAPTALAAPCGLLDTTITVASTSGFPIAYPYILILDKGTVSEEVVLVTAGAGNVLTVERGYDGTTAFTHTQDAPVAHGVAAIDPREANAHINASTGVHGVSGSVVGTSNAQTLTNKDLTSGTNTFPSSLATDAEITAAVNAHAADTTTHGVTGAVVGTTNAQTLTNKTLSVDSNTVSGMAASSFVRTDASGNLDGAVGSKPIPMGTVVGTSDPQTLSNKSISLGTNTLSGTKAQFDAALTDATFATTAGTETLTNKNLTSSTNTFPSTLATDAEVSAAVNAHANQTSAHGASGAVVGTTNTQTLSNKTLTASKFGGTGRSINLIYYGAGSVDTGPAGEGSFTHNLALGQDAYFVQLTSRLNGFVRHFTVIEKNANNFKVRVNNAAGDPVNGSSITFDYVIIT